MEKIIALLYEICEPCGIIDEVDVKNLLYFYDSDIAKQIYEGGCNKKKLIDDVVSKLLLNNKCIISYGTVLPI